MESNDNELFLRTFQKKDLTECRELFSAGMIGLITPMAKMLVKRHVVYALVLLFAVVVVRWSFLDVFVYLGVYTSLVAVTYIHVYMEMTEYIKNVLNTDLLDIDKYYNDGSCMFVAELGNKVVGMCAVTHKEHHKPGEAELLRMSVSPAIRKRGIGRKLLNKVEEFCKKQKYDKLILSTTNGQPAAMCLYKKCGFEVIDIQPNNQRLLLQHIQTVTFQKRY